MKDIIDRLKEMDKNELSQAVKAAREFIATPEGQELMSKVKNEGGIESLGIEKEKQGAIKKELEKNPHIAKTIFDILNGKG